MAPIAWSTVVTAYDQQRPVSAWARSRRCFVKPSAFYGRLLSLGTLEPHPIDVEAALCFDRSTWTFYRRHGYITDWHVSAPIPDEDQWDVAEVWEDLALETESDPTDLTVPIRNLPVKELHVLRMTIEGRSAYDISRALGLNPSTINYYKTRIKKRLNIMTFRDWRLRHPDITAILYEATPLRKGPPLMLDITTLPTSSPLVFAALAYAAQEAEGDSSGHDIHHIARVYQTARTLCASENGDLETVELIAALHDVKDFKFTGDTLSGSRDVLRWLLLQEAPTGLVEAVAADIAHISFKGKNVATGALSLEGQIVQDADRLDAIGAVGIARVFAYGGTKGRAIYDPTVPVMLHNTVEEYLSHKGTSITHFYEKLLLVKDRMNTPSGKRLAAPRHAFLERYLEQFYNEVGAQRP